MQDEINAIRPFLYEQTTLVLATTCENGAPWSTPLFFLPDESMNLYWFSSRSSLHSQNCAARPEASVSISANVHSWRQIKGIQMQGRVSVVRNRSFRKSVTAQYIDRFNLANLFSLAIRRSSLYCFTPAWLRYLDNSRHFGYKFEFNLLPRKPQQT